MLLAPICITLWKFPKQDINVSGAGRTQSGNPVIPLCNIFIGMTSHYACLDCISLVINSLLYVKSTRLKQTYEKSDCSLSTPLLLISEDFFLTLLFSFLICSVVEHNNRTFVLFLSELLIYCDIFQSIVPLVFLQYL